MKEINVSKCFTIEEMVEIVTNLSDVDTALDIINEGKNKLIIRYEIKNSEI